jgi:hypothetical protein
MPTINFAEVKGLEPLPVGKYPATIVAATEGLSKAGNTKIDIQWKLVGGKYDGRIVFDSLVFTPQTLFRVKGTLVQLGFPKNFKGNVGPQDLIGKSAEILLEIEASTQIDEDSGEPYPPRNRVKKVKALPSAKK